MDLDSSLFGSENQPLSSLPTNHQLAPQREMDLITLDDLQIPTSPHFLTSSLITSESVSSSHTKIQDSPQYAVSDFENPDLLNLTTSNLTTSTPVFSAVAYKSFLQSKTQPSKSDKSFLVSSSVNRSANSSQPSSLPNIPNQPILSSSSQIKPPSLTQKLMGYRDKLKVKGFEQVEKVQSVIRDSIRKNYPEEEGTEVNSKVLPERLLFPLLEISVINLFLSFDRLSIWSLELLES